MRGRILHHLKHNLWRPECGVLFVGFQAEGSMGRRLVEGGKKVRIMGEEISVKAHIYNLEGLSAHADRDEIIDWLSCFVKKTDPGIPGSWRAAERDGLVGAYPAAAEHSVLYSALCRYGDPKTARPGRWRLPPKFWRRIRR